MLHCFALTAISNNKINLNFNPPQVSKILETVGPPGASPPGPPREHLRGPFLTFSIHGAAYFADLALTIIRQ